MSRLSYGRGFSVRACSFSPHGLRHRRVSVLHHAGRSWAEIGELGQRSKIVTADRYTHVIGDYREIDRTKLLARARTVHTAVQTSAPNR